LKNHDRRISNDPIGFPQLSPALVEACTKSSDELTRSTPKFLAACFDLDQLLPKEYGWRFMDVDGLRRHVPTLSTPREINTLIWKDQAGNAEAYAMMTFWRGMELLKPAIRSLNVGEVITPAVLSRSALELASAFVTNANFIDANLGPVVFPPGHVVSYSPEFEEKIIKMIWGQRLGDPQPHVKQTNVMTILQKLSKNPQAAQLLPTYDYLCEISHPNFMGNARFWSHLERMNPDGSQTISISRKAQGASVAEINERVLWSIGWSAACLRNGYALIHNAIESLLLRLERAT
jgi:hypothetical protein